MAIWFTRDDDAQMDLCGPEYIPKTPGTWLAYSWIHIGDDDVEITSAEIEEREDFLRLTSHVLDAAATIGVHGVVCSRFESSKLNDLFTVIEATDCAEAERQWCFPVTGEVYRRFEAEWSPDAIVLGRGPIRDLCSRVARGGEHIDHESILFVVTWGWDLDVVYVWVREKDVDEVAGVMATAWRELAKRVPQPPQQSE